MTEAETLIHELRGMGVIIAPCRTRRATDNKEDILIYFAGNSILVADKIRNIYKIRSEVLQLLWSEVYISIRYDPRTNCLVGYSSDYAIDQNEYLGSVRANE